MKIPRSLTVFLCSAGALLALALVKALLVGGLETLPPAKILTFAASTFGLVAAGIDWALLRDILPVRRSSRRIQAANGDRARLLRVEAERSPTQIKSEAHSQEGSGAPPGLNPSTSTTIECARLNPIVFREIFPPPTTGLSFYGGVPIGPEGFTWPRARNKRLNASLSFVMQWDCSELAKQDPTGLLPDSGVLYLFCDLTWGEPFDFQFVHVSGSADEWHVLPIPTDLPPVYGDEGVHLVPYCSPRVEKRVQDVPRLLPRWPFASTAFSYPDSESGGDTDGRFWNDGGAVGEALLTLESLEGSQATEFHKDSSLFGRPFPTFPHDYAAVRLVAAELLDRLHRPNPSMLRDKFEHDRMTILQRWRDNAAELYTAATSHPPAARVERSASDRIWGLFEEMAPALQQGWNSIVQECVNTSLGIESEASSEVPTDLMAVCAQRHRLASVYLSDERHRSPLPATDTPAVQTRSIHAPHPNHMFGPPSFVQGHVEEYLEGWVLLLELSSRKQIGHEFGEGVYQFMIRPAHLRERQFGQVRLIASAY